MKRFTFFCTLMASEVLFQAAARATTQDPPPSPPPFLTQWFDSNGDPLVLVLAEAISWGDYDMDGWPDLLAGTGELRRNLQGDNWSTGIMLPIQDPAQFRRYGAVFGDHNNDGFPDVATEPRKYPNGFFEFCLNLGGSGWDEIADDVVIGDINFSFAETGCWVDADFDNNLDFFLPRYIAPNGEWFDHAFFHNTGPLDGYRLEEKGSLVGLVHIAFAPKPEGAQTVDLDFDGDADLYSNGIIYQNRSVPGTPLFVGITGDVSGIVNWQNLDEGAAFLDYDMDGDLDLVLYDVSGTIGDYEARIYEAFGDGSYFITPADMIDPQDGLNPFGLSTADWDNDGDIDLTVNHQFFKNDFIQTGSRGYSRFHKDGLPSVMLAPCLAWADWDLDGDLDCCAVDGPLPDSESVFYFNTTYAPEDPSTDRHYLRIRALRDDLETEFGAMADIACSPARKTRARMS